MKLPVIATAGHQGKYLVIDAEQETILGTYLSALNML